MNCGNCGKGNPYKATICAHCGSTLALTEYFRPSGFVEKPPAPKEPPQQAQPQKKVPLPQASPTQGKSSQSTKKTAPAKQSGRASEPPKKSAPAKSSPKTTQTSKPSPKTASKQSQSKTKAPSGKQNTSKAPQVYNRTTNKLSIAEMEVQKKGQKPRRLWLFPLILIMILCAIAIFVGRVQFYTDDERYTQIAEQFVEAVATNDEASVSQCVHSKMHGSLRTLGYENVTSCVAKAEGYEELAVGNTGEELNARFGIEDNLTRLFRVHVKYTVYAEETYNCSMDVLIANLGGKICAIKTENIQEAVVTSE